MAEKINTYHIPDQGEAVEIDWDQLSSYYPDESSYEPPVGAELINRKEVGKGETATEAKSKKIGRFAFKAVFTPRDDRIAKAA